MLWAKNIILNKATSAREWTDPIYIYGVTSIEVIKVIIQHIGRCVDQQHYSYCKNIYRPPCAARAVITQKPNETTQQGNC